MKKLFLFFFILTSFKFFGQTQLGNKLLGLRNTNFNLITNLADRDQMVGNDVILLNATTAFAEFVMCKINKNGQHLIAIKEDDMHYLNG